MNKAKLIETVAENTGTAKKKTAQIITAAIEAITQELACGEKVRIVGFGLFEVRERDARIGCNPKTREQIDIPPSKVPVFKPSEVFKEQINGRHGGFDVI